MEADDLPRRAPPAMDLNNQIGPAGEEATLRAKPRAQLDRLVVVEAHLFRLPPPGKVCAKVRARKSHLSNQLLIFRMVNPKARRMSHG
jgi:hypothetical protein